MSPEQARARPSTGARDIWAFGCVLYEMLTGRRRSGATSVATRSPRFSSANRIGRRCRGEPQRIRELLRHRLDKDPRQRLHDIGDARIADRQTLRGNDRVPGPSRRLARRSRPDGALRPPSRRRITRRCALAIVTFVWIRGRALVQSTDLPAARILHVIGSADAVVLPRSRRPFRRTAAMRVHCQPASLHPRPEPARRNASRRH